jgi:hypothetical protein
MTIRFPTLGLPRWVGVMVAAIGMLLLVLVCPEHWSPRTTSYHVGLKFANGAWRAECPGPEGAEPDIWVHVIVEQTIRSPWRRTQLFRHDLASLTVRDLPPDRDPVWAAQVVDAMRGDIADRIAAQDPKFNSGEAVRRAGSVVRVFLWQTLVMYGAFVLVTIVPYQLISGIKTERE